MTAARLVMYMAIIIAVDIAFFFIQFALHKRMKWWLALILFVVKFALSALFALLAVAITSPFGWQLTPLTIGLYLTCLGDCVADIVALIYCLAKKRPMNVWGRGVLGLIFVICLTTFGMVNMQTINPQYHTYTSSKLEHEYKGIFVSDIHYGTAQFQSVVEKALLRIKNENADFLLLGGDITDEYTSKEEMEWIFKKIGEIGIPTYFIYGNHDRQPKGDSWAGGRTYTDQEFIDAVLENGIEILKDDYVVFADDLVILGREDYSAGDDRLKVSELPILPTDKYVINMDHSPYQYDDITNTKADLQLSGHTHGGQYFPMGFNLNIAVKNVYGSFKYGDTDLFVSAGFAGWKDPVKTHHFCNYEVIYLKPAK